MIEEIVIQVVVMLAPLFLFCFIVECQDLMRRRRGEQKPSKELMLRSPGHSLRRKIADLDWEVYSRLFVCMGVSGMAAAVANQAWQTSRSFLDIFLQPSFQVCLCFAVWLVWKMTVFAELRRRWRLGLSGELAVGEELNRLMLRGCYTFHDFPAGKDWNIDHIVIAPTGVFSIETKAFTKRKFFKKAQREYEVIYSEAGLEFPTHFTKKPIEQARRNASQLARFLKESAAENVEVIPMVVPIGWLVTSKVTGPQEVLNVKWVPSAILDRPRILSEAQIQRICHQIEQKCRDVEF